MMSCIAGEPEGSIAWWRPPSGIAATTNTAGAATNAHGSNQHPRDLDVPYILE